jgi:methylphosphotriester-DNA--protein-cysteine methyltransferase
LATPSDDRTPHQKTVEEALKNLDRVDEQLNLAKDHIARASYHSRKARSAIDRIGGLPAVALSLGGLLLAGAATWSLSHRPGDADEPAALIAPAGEARMQLVGSRLTARYHRPTCPHAGQIDENNRVAFYSIMSATEAGFRPCKHCMPDADP